MIRVLLLNGAHKKKIRKRRIQLKENYEVLENYFNLEIASLVARLKSNLT
jgi:hypothetical protein